MRDDSYIKKTIALLLCLFVPLLCIFSLSTFGRRTIGGISQPFTTFWNFTSTKITGALTGFFSEGESVNMDIKLHDMLNSQRNYEAVKKENQQLRAMLGIKPPVEWKAVHAGIIVRDPVNWNWEFWINKGDEDGISVGDPVLIDGFMIGRVAECMNERARIVTIHSPECKFSAALQNAHGSSYHAIVHGCSNPCGASSVLCEVDYLPKDAEIAVDDVIITSGIGGHLPFGIPVGTADYDIENLCPKLVDNARAKVAVKPFANFDSVSFVSIYIKQQK